MYTLAHALFEGYPYTVLVSNAVTNPRLDDMSRGLYTWKNDYADLGTPNIDDLAYAGALDTTDDLVQAINEQRNGDSDFYRFMWTKDTISVYGPLGLEVISDMQRLSPTLVVWSVSAPDLRETNPLQALNAAQVRARFDVAPTMPLSASLAATHSPHNTFGLPEWRSQREIPDITRRVLDQLGYDDAEGMTVMINPNYGDPALADDQTHPDVMIALLNQATWMGFHRSKGQLDNDDMRFRGYYATARELHAKLADRLAFDNNAVIIDDEANALHYYHPVDEAFFHVYISHPKYYGGRIIWSAVTSIVLAVPPEADDV